MNNKYKNIIAFLITIIFILSGVFLVYKTEGNVVSYFIEKLTKNEKNDYIYNDSQYSNLIETKNSSINISTNNEINKEDNNINETTINTTKNSSTNTKNNELVFVEVSTNSEIKNNNTPYRKTYVDPKNPDIMHVIDGNYDKNYFKNTLFIGDSRVDGLKLYANVPDAHYFCSTGLTEYTLFKNPLVVPNVGNIYLEFLVASNNYDKIYVQMGINRLGTNFNTHVKEFKDAINKLQVLAPNSKIFIVSNMHIINKKSEESKYINNKNIDLFNDEIKKLADNKNIFYIDVNPFLDDEKTGVLNEEYTKDGVHLLPKYYDIEMDVFYNFSRQ